MLAANDTSKSKFRGNRGSPTGTTVRTLPDGIDKKASHEAQKLFDNRDVVEECKAEAREYGSVGGTIPSLPDGIDKKAKTPAFITLEAIDDPVAYVLSCNLHRRQLTGAQLGIVGDKVRDHYDRKAKERQATSTGGTKPQLVETLPQADKGKSRDQAGKAVGVSGRTMDKAKKVRKKGMAALWKRCHRAQLAVLATRRARPQSRNRVTKMRHGEKSARVQDLPLTGAGTQPIMTPC